MSIYEPPVTSSPDPVADRDAGITGARVWRRIGDFRGGIHTSIAPGRPPGVAQALHTFQCYASTAGSLIPTPRLVDRIYRDPSDLTTTALTNEQFRIVGLFANSPVYSVNPSNANTLGIDECHTELFFATEWWTGSTSNATIHLDVSRYLRNTQNPVWESIWTRDIASQIYSGSVRPRNCVFGSQRSNSANVIKSGPQVVGFVFSGSARYFPSDTATSTSATDDMPGDVTDAAVAGVLPTTFIAHQNRMVIFPVYFTGDGANQTYVSSECAYWTEENDANTLDAALASNYFNILGGAEQASGYGAIASLTANELLLVKLNGGGLFIAGDLNTPTPRTLPYVRSTGLSLNTGTITPVGFIYPVDSSGIWLWGGGDTSEHITKHLSPDFWRPPASVPAYSDTPTAPSYGHANTQMCQWNEFVLIPNNFLWDTDIKGWWRILDTDEIVIHRWVADERGLRFWGSPSGWNTGADPVAWEFLRRKGATYFSWRSHPMEPTIEQFTTCDELVVAGTGLGKVRVSIYTAEAPDDPFTAEVEFTDAGHIQLRRARLNATGTGMEFRIESMGYDHDESEGSVDFNAEQSAPTVHYVDWAATASTQIPAW